MRILVVAPSWIGDAVISHALVLRLKELDPSAAIDVLAPPWTLPVYRRMAGVEKAIALPFGHGDVKLGERRRFARSLGPYDRAIVLPNSWKSALIPWHAGIALRTGYRGEMRYGLLNDLRVLDEKALPRLVERYAALAQPAGEALRRPVPAPRLTSDPARAAATLARLGLDRARPAAALVPGAEYGPAKRWPARHFAALAGELAGRGWQVWLLGSGKDAEATRQIRALAGDACVDLAGRTSLDDAIDLLASADRVVTNDSGLMHVAAALDRSLAALFGSSSPEFTPPLAAKARVISLELSCSPCFQRTCPLGHTDCLVKLEPARVLAELEVEPLPLPRVQPAR
ncbi:MAG TPA: lipopolysaccharide heptosyltransferase II [Usitatibacter sp.]|jgi:heptosyltransferase-2|nr:lipopolysaccharide heptosyltransferase II [Usitatibacter sp.]